MSKGRRKQKKRSSSDVLDDFIDESLRSASGTKKRKRRRRSSASSRPQKIEQSPRQKTNEQSSKKVRKAEKKPKRVKSHKTERSSARTQGEATTLRGLVEEPIDEILQNDHVEQQSKGKTIVNLVIGILVACVFIVLLIFYIKFDRAEVISGSMEPTLMTNEKVVIMNGQSPKLFNLVVFYPPTKSQDKYVKRVIGLPGDKVAYKDDVLYINGDMYDEPYLKKNKLEFAEKHPDELYTPDLAVENIPGVEKGTKVIPADMYFVLGDNRQNSQDSRFIGLIPKENLVGVVWKKDPLPQKIDP